MRLARETWLVFVRSIRPMLRSPVTVLFGAFQPLLYLALFGPLLGQVAAPGGTSSWQWFVPGLLIQLTLFGTAYAGFDLIPELRSGAQERLRVTPASRVALLLGRVAKNVVVLLVQAALLVAVAVAFGFRAPLGAVLLALLLLACVGVAIGSLSYAAATYLRHEYAFAPVLSSTTVPLMLLSGVLLPMTVGPRWLYDLSLADPLSHVVGAERAIVLARYGSAATLTGVLVTLGLLVVCVAVGTRAFRRANA